MPSDRELLMYQKATVYDLLKLMKRNQSVGERYTFDEIKAVADAYIEGIERK